MPKRKDIKKILIVGAGPIIIGQACEFDYSGTQACKSLKEEGYEIILINSNPATIMTDPELAHKTFIEPITKNFVEEIIKKECLVIFELFNIKGWGRMDFFLNDENRPVILEINTVPGMTTHSLVPMAAKEQGIDINTLCLEILKSQS